MSQTILSMEPSQKASPEQKVIAPLWRTTLLVLVILGISANSYLQAQRLASRGVMSEGMLLIGYLSNIIVQWVLVAFVSWPMRNVA